MDYKRPTILSWQLVGSWDAGDSFWLNVLEIDQTSEAFRINIVATGNTDRACETTLDLESPFFQRMLWLNVWDSQILFRQLLFLLWLVFYFLFDVFLHHILMILYLCHVYVYFTYMLWKHQYSERFRHFHGAAKNEPSNIAASKSQR